MNPEQPPPTARPAAATPDDGTLAPTPPAATGEPRGLPVPAALFAPWRVTPFVVSDELGGPAAIDAHWLEDCEGETVYIAAGDLGRFRDYLERYLHDILRAETVPATDRAWAVHRALIHELAFLFARGSTRTRSRSLTTICRELAVFLTEHHDHDTLFNGVRGAVQETPVVHAAEVAIGSLSIAVANGQRTRDYLAVLAAGAAFADIGLLDLPQHMREISPALPSLERQEYWRHPQLSLQRMRDLGIVARVAQLAVRSHHERWDGYGEPEGLRGEQIPIEARYVALADAYASLTAVRGDGPRLDRHEALSQMAADRGHFDPHLLRRLIHLLSGGAANAPDSPTSSDATDAEGRDRRSA